MSQLEGLMLKQIGEAGLPAPRVEFRFHPQRRWRVDCVWDYRKVALEIEGGSWASRITRHTSGAGFEADCEKYNELALAGYTLIRVTASMVRDGRAIQFLRRALKRE